MTGWRHAEAFNIALDTNVLELVIDRESRYFSLQRYLQLAVQLLTLLNVSRRTSLGQ